MRTSSIRVMSIFFVLAAATLSGGPALADNTSATFQRVHVIPIPGAALRSFDIGFVARSSQTYYFADRSNKAVDLFDARTDTFMTRITGFKGASPLGNEHSGPNGLLVVHDRNELWVGDGDSTVKVIDLATNSIVKSISTGGAARADEMSYDQKNKLVLVANDAEDVPFVSLIDVPTREIVKKISFPEATNGLEQSVWDPTTQLFYQNVPEVNGDALAGEVAAIDPVSRTIVKRFTVKDCQPAGLALGPLGPTQQLLLGCSGDNGVLALKGPQVQIMNARTGSIAKVLHQVGGADEVWYNPGDKHYYVAARRQPGGPVLGVIDAMSMTFIENVPTGPAAHSVAANPINDHIYVPIAVDPAIAGCANGCIAVFHQQ